MPSGSESNHWDMIDNDFTSNFPDIAEAWGIDEPLFVEDSSSPTPLSSSNDDLDFNRYTNTSYLELPQPSAPSKSPNSKNLPKDSDSKSIEMKNRVDTFRRLLELSHGDSSSHSKVSSCDISVLNRHLLIGDEAEANLLSEDPTIDSLESHTSYDTASLSSNGNSSEIHQKVDFTQFENVDKITSSQENCHDSLRSEFLTDLSDQLKSISPDITSRSNKVEDHHSFDASDRSNFDKEQDLEITSDASDLFLRSHTNLSFLNSDRNVGSLEYCVERSKKDIEPGYLDNTELDQSCTNIDDACLEATAKHPFVPDILSNEDVKSEKGYESIVAIKSSISETDYSIDALIDNFDRWNQNFEDMNADTLTHDRTKDKYCSSENTNLSDDITISHDENSSKAISFHDILFEQQSLFDRNLNSCLNRDAENGEMPQVQNHIPEEEELQKKDIPKIHHTASPPLTITNMKYRESSTPNDMKCQLGVPSYINLDTLQSLEKKPKDIYVNKDSGKETPLESHDGLIEFLPPISNNLNAPNLIVQDRIEKLATSDFHSEGYSIERSTTDPSATLQLFNVANSGVKLTDKTDKLHSPNEAFCGMDDAGSASTNKHSSPSFPQSIQKRTILEDKDSTPLCERDARAVKDLSSLHANCNNINLNSCDNTSVKNEAFSNADNNVNTGDKDEQSSDNIEKFINDDINLANVEIFSSMDDSYSSSEDSSTESHGLIDISRVHPCLSFTWINQQIRGVATFPSPQVRVVKDISASVFFKAILYRAGPIFSLDKTLANSEGRENLNFFSSIGLSLCSDPIQNELLCEQVLLLPPGKIHIPTEKIISFLDYFVTDQFNDQSSMFNFERRIFCDLILSLLKYASTEIVDCLNSDTSKPAISLNPRNSLTSSVDAILEERNGPTPNLEKKNIQNYLIHRLLFYLAEGTFKFNNSELETFNRILLFENNDSIEDNSNGISEQSRANSRDQLELMRFCLDKPVLLVLFGSLSSAAKSSSFIAQIGTLIKEQFPLLSVDEWGDDINESRFTTSSRAPYLELVFRAYLIYDQCSLAIHWLESASANHLGYLRDRWPFIMLHALQIRPPTSNSFLYISLASTFLKAKLSWIAQLSLTLAKLSSSEEIKERSLPVVIFKDVSMTMKPKISLQLQWIRSYVACIFLGEALRPFDINLEDTLASKRTNICSKWSEWNCRYDYLQEIIKPSNHIELTSDNSVGDEEAKSSNTSFVDLRAIPVISTVDEKPLVPPGIPVTVPVAIPPTFPITNAHTPSPISGNVLQTDSKLHTSFFHLASNASVVPSNTGPSPNNHYPSLQYLDDLSRPSIVMPSPISVETAKSIPIISPTLAVKSDDFFSIDQQIRNNSNRNMEKNIEPSVNAFSISKELDEQQQSFSTNRLFPNPSLLESIKNFFSGDRGGSRRVKADLGSSNEMVFDKELRRWINPKLPRPKPIKAKPPPLSSTAIHHFKNSEEDIFINESSVLLKYSEDGSSLLEDENLSTDPEKPQSFVKQDLKYVNSLVDNISDYGVHRISSQTQAPSFSSNNNPPAITVRRIGGQRQKYVDPFNLTTTSL